MSGGQRRSAAAAGRFWGTWYRYQVRYQVPAEIFNIEQCRTALYYGFGARLKPADRTKFSLRVPLGISCEFEKADVDIFMEVVPMMDLAPATRAAIAGGVGFRCYF